MSATQLSKSHESKLIDPSDDNDVMEQVIQHLGGMGTYQRLLFLMLMPLGFIYSFIYSVQIFIAATPQEHWCKVPQLMHLDINLRRNLSIPGASSGSDWDRCSMFDANWTEVLATLIPPDPGTPTVPCQNGWEFVYNDIPYSTVVSEREWVCDKASYAPTAQALFFVGSLIGGGVFGWMGDKYGRVPSLIGANMIGCIGGIAGAFTTGLWDFIICRFLVGMANDNCFMMMYIIVLEYVGPKHRSWIGNLSFALYCGIGGVLMPVLALWLKDWRRLLIVTSLPMLLVIAAPYIVPESARWLASCGKSKQALKVLRKFERVNKTKIPEDVLQKFITSSNKKSETDESMSALLRSAPLRNSLLCLLFVAIACCIIIDGIIRLSETIGDNLFVTFAMSSVMEIPSLTLVAFILDRSGRRFLSFLTVFTAGALSLVCAFVPQGTPQLILALMVRFSINMPAGIIVQLATELLPTGLRAMGSSIIHMTMFIATAFSPYIVYSGKLWNGLPLVILGVLGVLGGSVALLLPETKGQPMPQTIADGEKLVLRGMLCGKPEKEDLECEEVIYLENKNAITLE